MLLLIDIINFITIRAAFRILLRGGGGGGQNSCFRIPGGDNTIYIVKFQGGQTSSKGGRMPPPLNETLTITY